MLVIVVDGLIVMFLCFMNMVGVVLEFGVDVELNNFD